MTKSVTFRGEGVSLGRRDKRRCVISRNSRETLFYFARVTLPFSERSCGCRFERGVSDTRNKREFARSIFFSSGETRNIPPRALGEALALYPGLYLENSDLALKNRGKRSFSNERAPYRRRRYIYNLRTHRVRFDRTVVAVRLLRFMSLTSFVRHARGHVSPRRSTFDLFFEYSLINFTFFGCLVRGLPLPLGFLNGALFLLGPASGKIQIRSKRSRVSEGN